MGAAAFVWKPEGCDGKSLNFPHKSGIWRGQTRLSIHCTQRRYMTRRFIGCVRGRGRKSLRFGKADRAICKRGWRFSVHKKRAGAYDASAL